MDVSYTVTEGEDLRNSAVDATRFQQTFCWQPRYALAETTANIIRSKWNEAVSV